MDEEAHRRGVGWLAQALAEVVERRGKKDLREWDGPAAGTVSSILNGTWATSPQARGTFEKLDKAGPWRPGTARLLYQGNPAAVAVLADGPEYLRSDLEETELLHREVEVAVPPALVTPLSLVSDADLVAELARRLGVPAVGADLYDLAAQEDSPGYVRDYDRGAAPDEGA